MQIFWDMNTWVVFDELFHQKTHNWSPFFFFALLLLFSLVHSMYKTTCVIYLIVDVLVKLSWDLLSTDSEKASLSNCRS